MEWSVLDWNSEAQDFYDEVGAEPLEDRTVMRLDEEAIEEVAATPDDELV